MWSSILVNQCPVPAGTTTTSPGFRSYATPFLISEPLLPGPLNSTTDRKDAEEHGAGFTGSRSNVHATRWDREGHHDAM
jgi:hypothetical protein